MNRCAGSPALFIGGENDEDVPLHHDVRRDIFRARPRVGDIGKASGVVNEYFKPYNYRPTTTNIVVLELGEPEPLVEIQALAVVD